MRRQRKSKQAGNGGMADNDRAEALITSLLTRLTLRAPSLIITVLGDAIAAHGGSFWIGSMIEAMAPFGLNERLVRTSIFRLTRENWLTATQIGRRSYYSLTGSGIKRFEEAFHRVYDVPGGPWDGTWTLAMVDSATIAPEDRDRIRREMTWAGFGTASNFVFAHATLDTAGVRGKLADLGILDQTVILSSRIEWPASDEATLAFVRRCWDLDRIAQQYAGFLESFRPLWHAIRDRAHISPETAFMVRTLLIHEYRRLTLRDPQLPAELTAPDWEGAAARTLTRNIYRRVAADAERYLTNTFETADGPLPAAAAAFRTRFGGLD